MAGDTTVDIKFTRILNRYALTAYRVCLSRRRLRAAAFRIIGVVFRYFFVPQFRRKRGAISCPVVNVDHVLDETIPFKPEHRPVYISFTMLWISTIGYLHRSYGRAVEGDIFNLFRLMERAYMEAFGVYSRIMSTTSRPKARRGDIGLKLMQAADPHLHCVPSLHVMIVCLTWLFLDRVAEKRGNGELRGLRNLVYRQSIMIIESILFMKQHSVNCIPAGLFALTGMIGDFTPGQAEEFIGRLFTELEPDFPYAEEVRNYIVERYRSLLEGNHKAAGDPKEALIDFLREMPLQSNTA